ncbi:MAG: homocysteine S-methyltransferase family protein [Leptospirillia bacterium]
MIPLLERLKKDILILDGSMGALLQGRGLPPGYAPDLWNLERPKDIQAVHAEYRAAGSDILLTNTFGASRRRLAEYQAEGRIREINHAGVELARRAAAGKAYVAGDIGPFGSTIAPFGDTTFEEAVAIFREQASILAEAGVDLIAIETMFDIQEMRAALIGVREGAPGIPVMAFMTYNADGITDSGSDPETVAAVLEGFSVEIMGLNCSVGPEAMLPVLERLGRTTHTYLGIEPNAGLPVHRDGKTVYPSGAEEMASFAPAFAEAGANIVGGCCGTTPDYIRLISKILKGRPPRLRSPSPHTRIASRTRVIPIGTGAPFVLIGEKINPTGKKLFSEAIAEGRTDLIVAEARKEAAAGAHALDVNVGVPLVDEALMMEKAVIAIGNVVSSPLVIDSSFASALESGLRIYPGRALVNSVNAEDERLEEVLPLIRRYGASVIGLLSGDDIPEKAIDRMKNAEKILRAAERFGLSPRDIVFDTLALTVSAVQEASRQTLETIRLLKSEWNAHTVVGLSNVSFGLPMRKTVHDTFLAMAIGAGLDGAICDPYDPLLHQTVAAASLFSGRDPECRVFIIKAESWTPLVPQGDKGAASVATATGASSATQAQSLTTREKIERAIIEGEREAIVPLVESALAEGMAPFDIFVDVMTPAIRKLGDLFGARQKFIPHLIAGADTMKKGVEILQPLLEAKGPTEPKGTIVFATVKGDIHDIGKNICILMLRNFGFRVIDLGRNVPLETILETAEKEKAQIVALSALMTTTMIQMKVAVDAIRERNLPYKVIVGGAVVTPKFSTEIGADGYGKDVGEVVPLTEKILAAMKEIPAV